MKKKQTKLVKTAFWAVILMLVLFFGRRMLPGDEAGAGGENDVSGNEGSWVFEIFRRLSGRVGALFEGRHPYRKMVGRHIGRNRAKRQPLWIRKDGRRAFKG